jgi:hypothetical protein
MAITVLPKPDATPEENVCVCYSDAELIAKIRDRIGKIEAIMVTRWLTKANLLASKNFVESLPTSAARCSSQVEQPQ